MLSVKSLTRLKLFIALEAKSLLKLFRRPLCSGLTISEISSQKVRSKKFCRCYSSDKQKDEIVTSAADNQVSTNPLETVKETTKTVTYTGIIAIGLGITGIILYTISRELFSGNSANNIYSKALDRCLKNEKVLLSLGEPIKAFGEETSRGRRRHTNHLLYSKDGINYIRMKFFIKGSRKKATVHLEMKENESRNFEYRYLFVQLDEYPYTTIVLEDNRTDASSVVHPSPDSMELS